jgi:hypothetical protein
VLGDLLGAELAIGIGIDRGRLSTHAAPLGGL